MGFVNIFKRKINPQNNSSIETMIYNKKMGTLLRKYEYIGMPEDIDPIDFELVLRLRGRGMFFKLGGHFYALPVSKQATMNVYGRLIKGRPMALNGDNFIVSKEFVCQPYLDSNNKIIEPDAVEIWNNSFFYPSSEYISTISSRLNYIYQTIGRNEQLSRLSVYFTSDNPKKNEVIKQEINRVMNSEDPIFVVDHGFDVGKDSLLNETTSASSSLVNLWEDFNQTNNYFNTILGINNANTDKRERLIVDEVNANNQEIEYNELDEFECRKSAISKINKMFNLNIQIRKREVESIPNDQTDDNQDKRDNQSDNK